MPLSSKETIAGLQILVDKAMTINERTMVDILNGISDDLDRSRFTIVVCGEFSNGKTSLVNTLVGGQGILPVSANPTTAEIHVLSYGEPEICIVKRDGGVEKFELKRNVLDRYMADRAEVSGTVNTIKEIKVMMESEILNDGVVIVDTPGVGDINETRSMIVDQMIPRADLLLLVLDAQTQLKASENEFLKNKLLRDVMPPLCIAVNKMDLIADAERNEVVDEVGRQVGKCLLQTSGEKYFVVPTSCAPEAADIQGVVSCIRREMKKNRKCLINRNKIEYSLNAVKEMLAITRIKGERALITNQEDINKNIAEAENKAEYLEKKWGKFEEYMNAEGPQKLEPLILRSYEKMHDKLLEKVMMEVKYSASPKNFRKTALPRIVELEIKNWIEQVRPGIKTYYLKYSQAMIEEARRIFGEAEYGVVSEMKRGNVMTTNNLSIEYNENEEDKVNIGKYILPGVIGTIVSILTGGYGAFVGFGLGAMMLARAEKTNNIVERQAMKMEAPEIVMNICMEVRAGLIKEASEMFRTFQESVRKAVFDMAESNVSKSRDIAKMKNEGVEVIKTRLESISELEHEIDGMLLKMRG